jgi:hypothetical protein
MTETAKTLTFMAAGAVALLAAFAVVPGGNSLNVDEYVGQRLNEFDVDKPKRLKIVKFDAETATPHEFEVAEDEGLWTIPSKDGYPADATTQMAEAANCLIDREILRVASTSRSEHAALGVINPSNAKLSSEADGVGTRVIMSDNNNVLTDMIVGKPVRDAEGQYHVRNTEQDIVYVVELDPSKLTTRFEDWIEDDLLKINPFDIRRIEIKDYTAELMGTAQGSIGVKWDRRAEMALDYNNTDSKWSAASLKKFDSAKESYVDYTLADGEEINEETLNKLRDGLDDLLLVDVERKPQGLSADLKAGQDFVKDNEAALNLMERGFAPIGSKDGESVDILSTEGEVVASLQDGVEYVLRFGNLQMEGDGGESKPAADAAAADAQKSDDSINRYLFVMARFNESLIEKPELEELPELPEGAEETEAKNEDGGEPASAGDKDEAESDTTSEESNEADAEEKSPEDEAKAKEIADIIAARKEIEEENQRRLDEYQAKLDEGKKHVAELNERFGDWYYVIPDDVFKQVHLSLDNIVKKKGEAKSDEGTAAPAASGIPGFPNLPVSGIPVVK